jgi:26S proteasome regulatory subunit N8
LLQDAFNALPSSPPAGPSPNAELAKALSARSNDMMLAAYMGSLVRAVLALHGLVDNRETAAARRREAAQKEEEKKSGGKKGLTEKEKNKEGGVAAAAGKEATADGKKK